MDNAAMSEWPRIVRGHAVFVARDASKAAELWANLLPGQSVPAIDFGSQTLLVVLHARGTPPPEMWAVSHERGTDLSFSAGSIHTGDPRDASASWYAVPVTRRFSVSFARQ
jgi:hypothetical protein